MWWHDSHKANYKYIKGIEEEYTNNKQHNKTHKNSKKSHIKTVLTILHLLK
jgi:hypothetical protein